MQLSEVSTDTNMLQTKNNKKYLIHFWGKRDGTPWLKRHPESAKVSKGWSRLNLNSSGADIVATT